MANKDRATSFDIAHRAGVSQSTVSRALRDSPLVNQATRDKIKAIAAELNYKVDKNASALRRQQSLTIALLLFADPTSDDSNINPFFLSMLGSITRACAKINYDLLVSFQNIEDDWHAEYEDTNKADGIILLGYGDYQDYRSKLTQLQQQGTHYVRWGASDAQDCSVTVGCDNYHGGLLITRHLLSIGRQHFAFIGGADNHSPEFMARYQGHCQALKQADVKQKHHQQDAISTSESGYQAAKALLQQHPTLDALVCASDLIAVGAIKACQELGLTVGTDISVVGYDNISVAQFTSPALTTVEQNSNRAGQVLVDCLLKLINNQHVDNQLLPAELIVRHSCRGQS